MAFLIIVLGIALDQLFKAWVVATIPLSGNRRLIPGILSLTHLQNNGAAWSSLEGQQGFFLILTPLVVAVAIWYLWRKMGKFSYFLGLSLVISGALGNFVDRVRLGYVVDMIQTDFVSFPIFNLADSLLTIGFVVLILGIIFDKDEN